MAFTKASFSGNVGAGSGALTLFVYKTSDTKAATVASGYFNDLASVLKVGDVILATTDTGTTAAAYALFVASNDGSTVTTDFVAVA